MKKVIAFGTFDLLHPGHVEYLRQAKELGDTLYVLVACDQAVFWAKKYSPQESQDIRLKKVQSVPFVDDAWIGEPVSKKEDYIRPILKVKPDIICLGYDQALNYTPWLEVQVGKITPAPSIKRMKPFWENIYKTSLIRKRNKSRE